MANSKKKLSPKKAVPRQITELESAVVEVRGTQKLETSKTVVILAGS